MNALSWLYVSFRPKNFAKFVRDYNLLVASLVLSKATILITPVSVQQCSLTVGDLSGCELSINLCSFRDPSCDTSSNVTLKSLTWWLGRPRLVASQQGCFLRRKYSFATAQRAKFDGFIAAMSLYGVRTLIATARRGPSGDCCDGVRSMRIENTWQQTNPHSTPTSRSSSRRSKGYRTIRSA